MKSGERGYLFQRSKFIEQLFKLVPSSSCKTSHKLNSITRNDDSTLDLVFSNGTTTTADAVIGGDGVHSIVRQHVLSNLPEEMAPFFSKQYYYIIMAPMENARKRMGEWFPEHAVQYGWLGDGKMLMHDPANDMQTMQVMVPIQTDETWEKNLWTKEKSEEEMREDLASFRGIGKACADVC